MDAKVVLDNGILELKYHDFEKNICKNCGTIRVRKTKSQIEIEQKFKSSLFPNELSILTWNHYFIHKEGNISSSNFCAKTCQK